MLKVKSSQVALIKTSDNPTSITCRNGNKIAKTSNIKFKKHNIKMSHLEAANKYNKTSDNRTK